jgi:hypothetical protein
VERKWIYAHAARLGGVRLGGRRGRLRFDLERATRGLTGGGDNSSPARPSRRASRRVPRCDARVDLLPYES